MKSFFCNVLIFRSSRSRIFFKLDVLKNFASLTGKHLCWSLILIKLQALRPATLLKTDSNTSVFLWNWRSFFMNSFFYRTPPVAASVVFAANQGNIQWTITLGYNQRLSWKYCNYYHSSLYRNIHLLSKVRPSNPDILQSFPPKSKLHDPAQHL